ncbi:hypothetical protein D3C72_1938140 [compost metagenome]
MFLINEMITFEKAHTTITAIAITIEGFIFTVTANAEQIPNICTVMGLLSFKGSYKRRLFFEENKPSFGSLAFLVVVVSVLIYSNLRFKAFCF